ncbi:MAG TPA: serine hydrolase domain-containing protein [Planctomycetaceae bacterium]|nr:serine hydrolase domain-containing protein [Planctomycetaceae bacterium]
MKKQTEPSWQALERRAMQPQIDRFIMTNAFTLRLAPAIAALACLLPADPVTPNCLDAAEMPRVAPRDVGLSSEKLQKVKSIVQAQVDKKRIAGAVVLVARHGKVAFLESFGKLDLKSGKSMPPDAIFRFYSMTKPITSVAALMLVEAGKLKLDDPVGNYLAELKDLRVYAGKDQTVPAKRAVTIRDLMRHTSGFTYGMPNGSPVDQLYIKNKIDEGTLSDLVRKLGTLPLQDQPGTKFNYSYSTDVLGRVIEVVSGEPLDKFFRERIFLPLEMRDTGFSVADSQLERFATGYARAKGGLRVIDAPINSVYRKHPISLSGGGGLVSTARDYCRFCQMLLNEGELNGTRLLRRDTIALMTSNQLPAEALPMKLGGFALPEHGFGLGVMVRQQSGSGPARSDGEYSWSGAASTFFWVAPKPQLIVIILQQIMPLDINLQLTLKPLIYSALTD